MKNTDRFILVGLFIGAFWLLLTNDYNKKSNLKPDELHKKIIEKNRYFTPEELAHLIISEDPSLQLIDVRDAKSYAKFTLKGALNIPLKKFLEQDNLAYLDQNVYKTIIFSNGNTDSDVAWILATRLGYKNVFVLKGGLNEWVEFILQPEDHSVVWDRIDDQMYQYRKGASEYFGGKKSEVEGDSGPSVVKPAPVKRKKKEVEGGCG